jgi:acyl carrier protein
MLTDNNPSSRVLISRDYVLSEVKKLVAVSQGISPDMLRETTNLETDLNFDSLEKVELTLELEEEFDITISDEIEQEIRTIADIVDGVMAILDQSNK